MGRPKLTEIEKAVRRLQKNDEKPEKKPKELRPPSVEPHRCVILASDAAASSGYSLWICDGADARLARWGEVDGYSFNDITKVIQGAIRIADLLCLPIVIVREKPFGGFGRAVSGVEAVRGVWKSAWVRGGGKPHMMVDAYPSEWRAAVLPKGTVGPGRKRDEVRTKEQECANAIVTREIERSSKRNGNSDSNDVSMDVLFNAASHVTELQKNVLVAGDSAPAIMIGVWGLHAFKVAKKIKKRKIMKEAPVVMAFGDAP